MTKWWRLCFFGGFWVLGACGEVLLGSHGVGSSGGQAGTAEQLDGGVGGSAGTGGGGSAGTGGGSAGAGIGGSAGTGAGMGGSGMAAGAGGSLGEAGSTNAGGTGAGGTGEPERAPLYGGPTPTSCRALDATCGDAESCCSTDWVPGGRFRLGLDNPYGNPAIVSDISGFWLDRYEVSVLRMQAFIDDYTAWRDADNPTPGAGEHYRIANSGWQSEWDVELPSTREDLENMLACSIPLLATMPAARELRPMPINCISWHVAFAFCAWDGGRLPTNAEWEFAATGGDQQRPYPWGSDPLPSLERAMVGCPKTPDAGGCEFAAFTPVGAHPLGAGRWSQHDLLGSVSEWVLDVAGIYPVACEDCATLVDPVDPTRTDPSRWWRGGSWISDVDGLTIADRAGAPPSTTTVFNGMRCARNPPPAPIEAASP
jgi:formylglycine-generating enzyme required for sulfatase activity